jgi:hypothetical protein
MLNVFVALLNGPCEVSMFELYSVPVKVTYNQKGTSILELELYCTYSKHILELELYCTYSTHILELELYCTYSTHI